MTQEELDALMAGGLDEVEEETKSEELAKEAVEEAPEEPKNEAHEEKVEENKDPKADDYRVKSNGAWPPPPPTDDHKMVHQLEDVTKDSEINMTEIFDKLEAMNTYLMDSEEDANALNEIFDKNIKLFTTLKENFPDIKRFDEALEDSNNAKEKNDAIIGNLQMAQDEIMMTMDIMQFQDIHRQKIERVINVMRALSKYMNSLFEGKIDDEKRVSSAVHIEGDSTENVVSNEEIEALISTLGKK